MNHALEVREITDDDVDDVIALWNAAGVSRPWNDARADLAFARKGEHAVVLAGLLSGRLVATAMVGEDGHRGWVYYVATQPDLQRCGIGRQMMQAAEAWLRSRGVWKLNLLVRDDNAAAAGFYEALGFRDTKTICFQKVLG